MCLDFYSKIRSVLEDLEKGNIDKEHAYHLIRFHEDAPDIHKMISLAEKRREHKKSNENRPTPNKRRRGRGRPVNNEKRVQLIAQWAYGTLHVPDSGVFRKNKYRSYLRELLDPDDSLRLSECIAIWNKYLKNDLLLSIKNNVQILIEENGKQRAASSIEDLRGISPKAAVLLFEIWAREAVSKYSKVR